MSLKTMSQKNVSLINISQPRVNIILRDKTLDTFSLKSVMTKKKKKISNDRTMTITVLI